MLQQVQEQTQNLETEVENLPRKVLYWCLSKLVCLISKIIYLPGLRKLYEEMLHQEHFTYQGEVKKLSLELKKVSEYSISQ